MVALLLFEPCLFTNIILLLMTSHTGEVITSDLNSLKTAINIRLSWTTERHYFFLIHYNMVYLVSTFLNNIIFLRCCCIEHGIWRLLHYFCVAFFDVWFIVASLSRHSPEFPYAFMHMRTLQKPADQCKSSQKHDLCKSVSRFMYYVSRFMYSPIVSRFG